MKSERASTDPGLVTAHPVYIYDTYIIYVCVYDNILQNMAFWGSAIVVFLKLFAQRGPNGRAYK